MYVFDSNDEEGIGFCFYDLDRNGTAEFLSSVLRALRKNNA